MTILTSATRVALRVSRGRFSHPELGNFLFSSTFCRYDTDSPVNLVSVIL